MKKLRAFLAVPISSALRESISKQVRRLATISPGVRWTDPEGLHITLKFFGEIEELETVAISRCVQRTASQHNPFDVAISSLGAFPDVDRPRTVWAGIAAGAEALSALQTDLENALMNDLGYKAERRRYHPHLTLGRVRSKDGMPELSAELTRLAELEIGQSPVEEVVFYSSEVHRSGAVYTRLATCGLAT